MEKTDKILNLLINFKGNLYKIKKLIRVKMNLYVIFELNIRMKQKRNLF